MSRASVRPQAGLNVPARAVAGYRTGAPLWARRSIYDGLLHADDTFRDLQVPVLRERVTDGIGHERGTPSGQKPLESLEEGERGGAVVLPVSEVAEQEASGPCAQRQLHGCFWEHYGPDLLDGMRRGTIVRQPSVAFSARRRSAHAARPLDGYTRGA